VIYNAVQPPKLPLPHLIYGYLGAHDSALQTASRSVQPFWQSSRTCPTDRHIHTPTDHATLSVSRSRICLLLRCSMKCKEERYNCTLSCSNADRKLEQLFLDNVEAAYAHTHTFLHLPFTVAFLLPGFLVRVLVAQTWKHFRIYAKYQWQTRIMLNNALRCYFRWAVVPGGWPIMGFSGAKFPKMGNSLPRTPINHRAKFDVASFIIGREISNCTNKQTNKQWTTYPHLAYRHEWIISWRIVLSMVCHARMMFIFVVVIEGVTQPDAWDPPDPHDPYRRKQLQQSSPEYQAVLRNVQKTAGSSVKQIIKVSVL